jgi:hypothetical protein
VLGCLWLVAACTTASAEAKTYRFTLDGKPFTPEIIPVIGTAAAPAAGDIVRVGQFRLVLGEDRECNFVTTPEEDGRLLLRNAGRESVIAVRVWQDTTGPYEDRKTVFRDPLSRLTDAQIRQLWGVRLAAWPRGIEKRLQHLDLSRSCIELAEHAISPSGTNIPPIPSAARYLNIDHCWFRVTMNGLDLSAYDKLVFLQVGGMIEATLDMARVTCMDSLRHLSISTGVTNTSALGNFPHLRTLCLKWCQTGDIPALARLAQVRTLDISGCCIGDVAFATGMRNLEELVVSMNPVGDLSPLGLLENLRVVNADNSAVWKLPAHSMPRLKELRVMQTRLADKDVAAFRAYNPACVVFHRWRDALATRTVGADRIDILDWSTGEERRLEQKSVHSIRSQAKVQEFLATIGIDEASSGYHCMCMGGPILKIFGGGDLLVEMTVHHGTGLRWSEGWPADAELTVTSQVAIAKWFARNGYPGLEKERLAKLEEQRQQEEDDRAFWACLPASVKTYFASQPWQDAAGTRGWEMTDYFSAPPARKSEVVAHVSRLIGDPVEAVVSACKALGSGHRPTSWSGRSDRESIVVSVATNVPADAFLAGLERVKEDKKAVAGAALLFFSEEQGSRLPSASREAWCLELGVFVLQDDGDSEKIRVLHWLDHIGTPKTLALLRDVAAGKVGTEAFWHREYETYAREPGTKATACLLLAMRQSDAAAGLINAGIVAATNVADKVALDVASVLAGLTHRIKKEHFSLTSSTAAKAVALAVEKWPSRENMDILVEHGIAHDYAIVSHPALRAFARIAGLDWYKGDEGVEKGQRDKAREWWKENRHRFKSAAEMK